MKLTADVRAIERALGNGGQNKPKVEKRNFKLNVRPASKPDSYYGYGTMSFILHGAELEAFPADLGDKLDLYLVREGEEAPAVAAIDDVKRELYEVQQKLEAAESKAQQDREKNSQYERQRWDASQKLTALQNENVRLTTELMTLKAAMGSFGPPPARLSNSGDQPEVVG